MPPRRGPPPVLDRRALNRALLARQLLLRRAPLPPARALEHLVGLQAQNPQDPYLALWTRLAPYDPLALSRLVGRRRAVRLAMMRSTIHLVTARDALALRPVLQPVQEQLFKRTPYHRAVQGLDVPAVVAAGRALLEQEPRTARELGRALQARWPGVDEASLGFVMRIHAPLVQVPPRGLWHGRGAPRLAAAEHWLGQPLAGDASPDALVLRYLRAFGPASVQDAQAWSGLTGLKASFERLRPRLRLFQDEDGRELFDLPRAPRPPAATSAPPRFLPEFDNVFLGHADRRRILADLRGAPDPFGGRRWSPFLLDGFVHGFWHLDRVGKAATLRLSARGPLAPRQWREVEAEAMRVLGFLAADARSHRVRFVAR